LIKVILSIYEIKALVSKLVVRENRGRGKEKAKECPHCQSQKIIKNGKHHHQDGKAIQNYLCKGCGKRFSERTGTPMSRLRTPAGGDITVEGDEVYTRVGENLPPLKVKRMDSDIH